MAERRYSLVLYGALVVAAAATYGAYRMIVTMQAAARTPTRTVIVAARDVPEGVAFDRLALATRVYPVAAIPEGAFRTPDSVVGRVARVAVFAGEPIVPGRLAPLGSGPGLETKIPSGLRAMSVRVNDVAGISGLLQPNSRVDVLVTLPDGNNNQNQIAKLFLENMQVLSVGTEVQRDKDGKPISATTVTLGVTPEEAERLAIAMNRGTIQLVLRGYGDPREVKTAGATSHDVLAQLGGRTQPAPAAQPAPKRAVRREAPPAPTPVRIIVQPPPPPRPDSLKIDVFHGDKPTRQTFEQSHSNSTASGLSP